MVEEDIVSLIRLHTTQGFGNSSLLTAFNNTKNPTEIISRIKEFANKPTSTLLSVPEALKQIHLMIREKISIIPLYDDRYPPQLRTIDKPPAIIYTKGDATLLSQQPSLAVVGTRRYSPYGKEVCSLLLPDVVKHNIPIISGMALGIDSFAHQQAILHHGPTVAVLGSGVNVITPIQNTNLYHAIIETGCVVSEFPLNFQAQRYTFTQRNRIVSGLAKALLVIEAGNKSGTMITTNYSLEQGKEVCAVPGPITSFSSQGTNHLLQLGATPITNSKDLLEVFSFKASPHQKPIVNNPTHQLIINEIYDGVRTIEELSIKTQIPAVELTLATSELELEGVLVREGEHSFTLAH